MSKKNITDIEDIAPITAKPFQVISASRRTDIPGCYLHKFMKSMRLGYIDVPNPRFPEKVYRISLLPKDVSCIAWWSKNYGKWIRAYKRKPEFFDQYAAHYFNFTINSDSDVEHLPTSLDDRLGQLEYLVDTFSVDAINYRFDPIVHYRFDDDPKDMVRDNLNDFEYIVSRISDMGITELNFSFCEKFPQVVKNMNTCGKILITLDNKAQNKVLKGLKKIADQYNVEMKSCCNSKLIGVTPSACISAEKIGRLLDGEGGKLRSKRKDPGQRKECNCVISRDVGIYDQVCPHGCDYCYANPKLFT